MSPLTEPTKLTLAKGQPVPNDPYFAFNSLLLHGNGTNGSTVITDSSGSPKTVTAVDNAQISTTQSKFGGASIAFDGSGDYALVASNQALQFGSDNFTLEAWIYPTSFGNYKAIVANLLVSETTWTFTLMANGLLRFQTYNDVLVTTSTGAVALNTWSHVALTRNGNNFTVFVNGSQQATSSSTKNFSALTATIVGGDLTTANYFSGYIDELRITKGVARYTSNFTPPTAPFPDF